jgi:hypothetical protein
MRLCQCATPSVCYGFALNYMLSLLGPPNACLEGENGISYYLQ